MMQATSYPAQPGMGPGHPGMAHGHPMQVQHGGHMGQPNPAMMGGMHPAMSGPQVTQGGPLASGMPPNPGTPAPGGPMQNAMAMAHLGGQGPMFHGNHPQMNMGQMQQINANMIARQRAMNMMQAQQNGQLGHGMMNMQNMPHGLNSAQLQQMKAMNIPMQQQMQHMTPQQQQMVQQQQQYQHQQRMMAQHAAQQQQLMNQQRQQAQQQAQQQHASQQMQMSRSQEPTTQPPQPQPTPAPQAQPPPQAQPQPNPQPQQQTPQQKPPQAQPPTSQPPQQSAPTPQIKQGEDEDVQVKPDLTKQQLLMDMAQQNQDFSGQWLLQLMSYYEALAYPKQPLDIEYWSEVMAKYYSPTGSMRQQIYNNKNQSDKSFQLQYPSLARFYYSHFANGVRKIFMQSFEHAQEQLPNGGYHVVSRKLYLTYEYADGLRVTTNGTLSVNFDEMQKIETLHIAIKDWTEYIPRGLADGSQSPEQTRQSPKMSKKNLPKSLQRPSIPRSPVIEWGIPQPLLQFLEIAEVMTTMGPLMEYYCRDQSSTPRDALNRFNAENAQMNANRIQNMNAVAANGQVQFQNQRMMQAPNQFQSPAFAHLNLPQNQQSPHMNHTPSPGHGQGGVQMVHQMSAQGSNLSGSQGPSTNTSPNVSNKRRRASQIKEEDTTQASGGDKTKPSPRVGKRQKGAPA